MLPEWDRAVAYYTGSLAMADGGHFLNTLAQIECAKFGTCKEGDMAPVNDQIFDLFNDGKANLQQSNCIKLEQNVADIRSLMTVPLLQGTLRAAHALDSNPDFQNTETTQGQGAAFAASILPLLNKCSAGNAQIVLNDLMPSKSVRVSYEVVKGALERSYDCFGVSCGDVGGILNLRKDGYLKGAEACGNVRPVESDVDYDDTLDDEEEDDRFEYEDYSYPIKPAFPSIPHSGPKDDPRSGTGDGHTGEPMDPTNAAILSGIAFGIFGFVGGAAITVACKSRKQKKKQSEVEFVTSSNGNGAIDENDVI